MDVIFEYKQILIEGTLVTVALAVLSLLLSVIMGLIGAFAKLSAKPSIRRAEVSIPFSYVAYLTLY